MEPTAAPDHENEASAQPEPPVDSDSSETSKDCKVTVHKFADCYEDLISEH